MITEDMVREGTRNGSVRFVKDPNMEHGTVARSVTTGSTLGA